MSDPNTLYDEANQLKEEGKLEEAVEKLQAIVAEHPDHLQSHLALGVHLQKLGRNEDALIHARRVTELEPNDSFSWASLSVICQRCGRIQEAEDAMAESHKVAGQ